MNTINTTNQSTSNPIIGYACINTSLNKEGKFRTMTATKALTMNKTDLIKHVKGLCVDNLYNTLKILQWNKEHNIYMYRLTSDMLPLVTHQVLSDWQWWEDKDIINMCNRIKNYVLENNMRISFHPSQYSVINSDKEEVFQNTVKDLEYHSRLSDMIGNKTLIIHTGGVKGNKQAAMQRFIDNFRRLPLHIQNKIVLENDDKSFNIEDVLYICETLNIPCCADFHHDICYPSSKPIETHIDRIIATWKGNKPKCHVSTGKDGVTDRKHADYISAEDFKRVFDITEGKFDYMFEAKYKELAVLEMYKNM